jgi:hypothetical protein
MERLMGQWLSEYYPTMCVMLMFPPASAGLASKQELFEMQLL